MILFFPQHKIEGFFLMKNVLNREINLTLCGSYSCRYHLFDSISSNVEYRKHITKFQHMLMI